MKQLVLHRYLSTALIQRYVFSNQLVLLERLHCHLIDCEKCACSMGEDVCAAAKSILTELAARQHLFDVAFARQSAKGLSPAVAASEKAYSFFGQGIPEEEWKDMPELSRLPVKGSALVIAGGTDP